MIDEKTALNSNLGGLGAFVGVWEGLSAPKSMNEIVGLTYLDGVSQGQFANKTIETNHAGVNLLDGLYSIGLFMRQNDVTSLVATAI